MSEKSYTVPEGIAAMTLHTSQSTAKKRVPELGAVKAITLDVYQINAAEVQYQSTIHFAGETGLQDAHEMICREGFKLLGFNSFNYGYRALSSRFNVAPYVPRTIDVFLCLWQLANQAAIAKTGKPATPAGAMRFTSLLLENLTDHPPRPDQRGRDLVDLWLKILRTNSVSIAEKPHKLTTPIGMKLIGANPQFENAADWARTLIEQGSVLGGKERGHSTRRDTLFLDRYSSYLTSAES